LGSLAAARLTVRQVLGGKKEDIHEGRVGGGVLGLVSTDRLEISRVGNDNGSGAVCQYCSEQELYKAYAFKASREVDIVICVLFVIV
jgi:hypothetical protein